LDTISTQRRSALMARIKAKDTRPEMIVRRIAFALGRRYRLHVSGLPGRPDLVFPRDHKIVFVHGCFWHQHAGCPVARMPASRLSYWRPKLEGNRKRDIANARRLRRAGWTLLTIRECELRNTERIRQRLSEFLHRGTSISKRPLASHSTALARV